MPKGWERLADIIASEYKKTREKSPDDVSVLEKHGLARLLEMFYSAMEDEVTKIFQSKGKDITNLKESEESKEWHKKLLSDAKEISLLSDATYEVMQELLKFRHWSRYGFLKEIDWKKLSENLDRVEACSRAFRDDVERFHKE